MHKGRWSGRGRGKGRGSGSGGRGSGSGSGRGRGSREKREGKREGEGKGEGESFNDPPGTPACRLGPDLTPASCDWRALSLSSRPGISHGLLGSRGRPKQGGQGQRRRLPVTEPLCCLGLPLPAGPPPGRRGLPGPLASISVAAAASPEREGDGALALPGDAHGGLRRADELRGRRGGRGHSPHTHRQRREGDLRLELPGAYRTASQELRPPREVPVQGSEGWDPRDSGSGGHHALAGPRGRGRPQAWTRGLAGTPRAVTPGGDHGGYSDTKPFLPSGSSWWLDGGRWRPAEVIPLVTSTRGCHRRSAHKRGRG